VSADEIFVLILVGVCAGVVAAMEIQSRRKKKGPGDVA
jgi:hypothetical protein